MNPEKPGSSGGMARPLTECGPGAASVLVDVEDNGDSGGGTDVFQISSCAGLPSLPPTGCSIAEGGILRTGNPWDADESERRAIREPSKQMRPHDRCVVLMIGDERSRNAIMRQQFLGNARVLGDDRVGGSKCRQGPEGNVAEIADWRGNDMKPRPDRLGLSL